MLPPKETSAWAPASLANLEVGFDALGLALASSRDRVVCILTGHFLKDPDVTVGYHQRTLAGFSFSYANQPRKIAASLEAVWEAIG